MGLIKKERNFLANEINNNSSNQEFLYASSKPVALIRLINVKQTFVQKSMSQKPMFWCLCHYPLFGDFFLVLESCYLPFYCFRFFTVLTPDLILEILYYLNKWCKTASCQKPNLK